MRARFTDSKNEDLLPISAEENAEELFGVGIEHKYSNIGSMLQFCNQVGHEWCSIQPTAHIASNTRMKQDPAVDTQVAIKKAANIA